jgi:hypothetical protein
MTNWRRTVKCEGIKRGLKCAVEAASLLAKQVVAKQDWMMFFNARAVSRFREASTIADIAKLARVIRE